MKGGVGKSTVTSVLCNYIFNELPEASVIAIDADDMQGSLSMLRKLDIQNAADAEGVELKDFDKSIFYDIITVSSTDVPASINFLNGQADYIFVDLPGNLKQEGVISSYLLVDTFLIPTTVNQIDFDATTLFIKELNQMVVPARKKMGQETSINLFLNKAETNQVEYKYFQEMRSSVEALVHVMDSELPASIKLATKTNTVDTYRIIKGKDKLDVVEQFCKEALEIINK
jgi:cellulose biosynthesis protein BcsQ